MKITQLVTYCLSIPKTLYFNFRCFELKKAIKLPIFISYKVKLKQLGKGIIEVQNDHIKLFMIKIGFNGTEEISPKKSMINLEKGKIIFKGPCAISEGCIIGVSNGGILEFGQYFSANRNFFVSCNRSVIFGDDVMIGWNVTLFDANGHTIFKNGKKKEAFKPILIGNHVWICSESHVLKGSEIANGSIIAYGSLIYSKFTFENSLYGGTPVRLLQQEIKWKR